MANSGAGISSDAAQTSGDEYQVFLSFRESDTRHGFTDFLYHGLMDAGIRVFKDDDEHRVGEVIGENLLHTMNSAMIYIPIFSRTYASSVRCLKELAFMVDLVSKSEDRKSILPIFLDVEPGDVKLRTPLYRAAFQKHQEDFPDEVEAWRKALAEVDEIEEWNAEKDQSQATIVKLVVEKVLEKLEIKQKSVVKHLVGLDDRVKHLTEELFKVDHQDVRFIGIYGKSGIGKTTIAKVIFNKLSSHFKKCCSFLENVRESSLTKEGILQLQRKLLSDIVGSGSAEQLMDIGDALSAKKVLVVLDDVDKKEHINKIIGGYSLHSGSRIIITTRNKIVLNAKGLKAEILCYEMLKMDDAFALQLFCQHAFNREFPSDIYHGLSSKIVSIIGGLPLTIEVIGSLLNGKDEAFWKETLVRLREVPDEDIMEMLRISYDSLDRYQQQIFLDVACFLFNENKTEAIYMWADCQFYPIRGLKVLTDRCLIKISDNDKIWMHDQLLDLGRRIVRQESPFNPGKRSRLWTAQEALEIMRTKKRKDDVQALKIYRSGDSIEITDEEFERLQNLRLLELNWGTYAGDFARCHSNLRWFSWRSPQDFRADNMYLEHLVVCKLDTIDFKDDSKAWELIKKAQNLKVLSITQCSGITRIPNFSKCSRLERLTIANCFSLERIDSFIGDLGSLTELKIEQCQGLRDLPEELGALMKLKHLSFSGCRGLRELPSSLKNLTSLKRLNSCGTSIVKLPEIPSLRRAQEIPVDTLNLESKLDKGAAEAMMEKVGDDGLVVVGRKRSFEYSSNPTGVSGGFGQESIMKPFDWRCTVCGCINFASGTFCFKCNEPQTDDAPPADMTVSQSTKKKKGPEAGMSTLPDAPPADMTLSQSTKKKGGPEAVTNSAMAYGEIIFSSCQVLFDKLSSLALGYWQRDQINATLLEWKGMLVEINAVLDDAEEKQLSDNRLVKLWLDDVRDLAYDMEDLLDDYQIEVAQAKSQAESSTSRGQRKRKFFSLKLPRPLVSDTRVQNIKGRLEMTFTEKAILNLRENAADISNDINKRLPSRASTSLSEPRFFGRVEEEAEILELLTSKAKTGNATLSIVPIVGMGGVGKTALAQRLYNDARVISCFEKRAWVCVSNVFDVLDITTTILLSITGVSNEGDGLDRLQVKLKNNLSAKKFLVVLDDIWNVNYGEWITLLKPFAAGAKGSKIIITTRNLSVVSLTGASPYLLKELSIDDCTGLLAFHALGATNFESHPDLESIGKELARRCKGVPLAAKTLGGALRYKRNPYEWEETLNSKMWDLPTTGDDVLLVLKLSYFHLPSYLKRCFAYCAVFPKDYEIEKDELVLLWIGEGFLAGEKAEEDILKLGRQYFDELVSRSFLQQSSVDTSKFSMHDLLSDLAKSIAGRTYFSTGDSQSIDEKDHASLENIRYASLILPQFVTSKCLRGYGRMKVLRSLTFLHVGPWKGTKFSISNKLLHDLLTNLKYLRVLSLCHCDITEVPKCVSDLKHLRYLNFSYTDIESLPDWIDGLCKLQVLILRGCQKLLKLPLGITKVVTLQFLDIRDTGSLIEMPLGISDLTNLMILPKFVVGLKNTSRLKELKNLSRLQGELFISELQRVKEVRDAVDANLLQKQGLTNLSLHWGGCLRNLHNHECEAQGQVLNSLKPHSNLESLNILYYGGAIFPSWLDCGSYSRVMSLCLRGCHNVTSLPSLGQLPSLRELSLEGLHMVSMIGSEFYGNKRPFPSLTTLKFEEMLSWKNWSPYDGDQEEVAPFSELQHLVIRNCPSLVGALPCRLEYLVKLEIRCCPHLNISTSAIWFPSLCELHLEDSTKEILKSLVNPTSLTILEIRNIAGLVCFDHGFMSYLVKLKWLHIKGCDELKYLWEDGNEMLNLTCLQELFVHGCPQFTSFVAGGGAIELPRNLERMELSNCKSLEEFPSKMRTLKYLRIRDCPKLKGAAIPIDDPNIINVTSQLGCQLTSFPCAESRLTIDIAKYEGVQLPKEIIVESLESLIIDSCENLESLPQCLHRLSHLACLSIYQCPSLEGEDFPPLPITLSSLTLWGCPKIKSIASWNIASCNNFTELIIWNCPALEIHDFPPLPITLLSLWLEHCPKIKSLPNQWHHHTSLREILIIDCPNIKCFPKGGWPPNLRGLTIWECETVKQPVREWGLSFLTSLQDLAIDGISMGGEGEKVCFPLDADADADADAWSLLFPSSLICLEIRDMRNVKRLSNGLCKHLSSLQTLWISFCPKLIDLPEDGLPPTLQQLDIFGCEKIPKDRYSKLAEEIPFVSVDGVRIR